MALRRSIWFLGAAFILACNSGGLVYEDAHPYDGGTIDRVISPDSPTDGAGDGSWDVWDAADGISVDGTDSSDADANAMDAPDADAGGMDAADGSSDMGPNVDALDVAPVDIAADDGSAVDVPTVDIVDADASDGAIDTHVADAPVCHDDEGGVCETRPNTVVTCPAGACVYNCAPGYLDCDGLTSDGCEVNGAADPNHCGACVAPTCSSFPNAPAACVGGACGFVCSTGFADCDGVMSNGCEVNADTDANHCGTCSTVCPGYFEAPPTCSVGTCVLACAGGHADCNHSMADGCEVDVTSNVTNCATCGTVCVGAPNANPVCQSGTCNVQCRAGFADCNGTAVDGCETSTGADPTNCGSCNTVCPVGAPNCVAGTCQ